jgi:8-oxo-dGTP pyrophosphatase MutT (NUDIX family)
MGYKNGANVIIIDPNTERILAVQHNYGEMKWAIPGGGVEAGESPEETARREVLEETGLTLSNLELFASFIQRKPGGEDAGEVFLYWTKQFSGQLRTTCPNEIRDVCFVDQHEILLGQRKHFSLGYKRMLAQWLRCSRGQDATPFRGRLSTPVEVRCRGNVLSI